MSTPTNIKLRRWNRANIAATASHANWLEQREATARKKAARAKNSADKKRRRATELAARATELGVRAYHARQAADRAARQ